MIDKEKFNEIYNPDYSKFPKDVNNPTFEEIYYIYSELHLNYKLIKDLFGNPKIESRYRTYLRNGYDIPIDIKENRRLSNLYYYGIEKRSHWTDDMKKSYSKMKQKEWKDKSETDIKNLLEKRKETVLDLYGVESYSKSNKFKEMLSDKMKCIWGSDKERFSSSQKEGWRKMDESTKSKFKEKLSNIWFNKSELKKLDYINFRRGEDISLEQYQILHDKDKFKQYLIEYKNNNDNYPTPDILKENFKFSISAGVLKYIHKYNLEDYVLWGKSSPEQEVYDYVKGLYNGEIIRNNRSILSNNKELDIYIPEKQLAIEFNGCYWHSRVCVPNNYHQNKSKECLSKGIRLIHIYEDEWLYKQDIVKDIIKSSLGVYDKIIYARKCIIKEVDKQAHKDMCKYHLQGYSPAQIILGLYYQDQLIQLASFSKSRYDKNYEYEWIRGIQLPGYQVIGGTSKLFKYFIKNYNPTSIICYSDFNKFSGNSYKNCGFNLDKITTPDMWFNKINGLKRINRQPSKHHLTKSLVESGDLLEMHGAGNMKWVWRKNNDR